MEEENAKNRLHPSLPPNYVSFLDLRERWMKQQQQQQQQQQDEQKELPEVQDDLEQVEAEGQGRDKGRDGDDDHQLEERHPDEKSVFHSNRNPRNAIRRPSRGNRRQGEQGNYRWVQVSQPNQAPAVTMIRPKQAPPIQASRPALPVPSEASKVETAGEIHGSDKEVSDRKLNGGKWNKAKEVRNQKSNQKGDLVQSQPIKGVLAPKADLEEENANTKVQLDPKALPVLYAVDQSKPPPLEAAKVEIATQALGEIHSSDKEVNDWKLNNGKMKKANVRNRRRNHQENLVQSKPNNGVLAPKADLEEEIANAKVPVLHSDQSKPPPLESSKVDRAVQTAVNGSDETVNDRAKKKKKKKPYKKNKKRNQNVEDVIQPQLKKEIPAPNGDVEDPEQEKESERENKDVDDDSIAETEGKLAGLSLTSEPEESCSRGSIAARNRRGWRKDGSYGKFEHRVMLKKERAKSEGGACLVWVKKGETSQIGAVPVENAAAAAAARFYQGIV